MVQFIVLQVLNFLLTPPSMVAFRLSARSLRFEFCKEIINILKQKKDFLSFQKVFSIARAGLGVPVADFVSAPSTPSTFAKLPSMATSQKIAAHCSQFSGRSLRFESCKEIINVLKQKKDFLSFQKVFNIARAGLGVPVADFVSAPSTPSTFADAALHGGFSPVGALTPLRVLK